jgi:hypothetical protein
MPPMWVTNKSGSTTRRMNTVQSAIFAERLHRGGWSSALMLLWWVERGLRPARPPTPARRLWHAGCWEHQISQDLAMTLGWPCARRTKRSLHRTLVSRRGGGSAASTCFPQRAQTAHRAPSRCSTCHLWPNLRERLRRLGHERRWRILTTSIIRAGRWSGVCSMPSPQRELERATKLLD